MSLIVIATIAAATAAIAAGAAIAARKSSRGKPAAKALPPAPAPPFDRLGMQPGDVVMRGRTELWLTGAWVLYEGSECVAAVFTAGGNKQQSEEALVVCQGPPRAIAWVRGLGREAVAADSIEIDGERHARTARIPVRIERHGEAAELAASGTWSCYESPGAAPAFALMAGDRTLIWHGSWEYEDRLIRMAAGAATFREE